MFGENLFHRSDFLGLIDSHPVQCILEAHRVGAEAFFVVSSTIDLLTNGDVTAGVRTRAERRLEREGIDVGSLIDDFVSHQAVHTYLTKFRNVEYPTEEPGDRIESTRETLQQLRSRTQAVTDTTVNSLRKNGAVAVGGFNVFVDIQVMCNDCQRQYPFDELLEEGSCHCGAE